MDKWSYFIIKPVINLILILLISYSAHSQTEKDKTVYIEYNENMIIKDSKSKISLSFSIYNSFDKEVNTYNFKINNLIKGFKTSLFKELRDTIVLNTRNKITKAKRLF
jgi:hypothetical protein